MEVSIKNSTYEDFYATSDFHRVIVFNRIKIDSIMNHANSGEKWLLDIGCGTGDDTQILSRFADNCVGLDFSKKGLRQAKKKYPRLNLVCGDALHLPFRARFFDKVFSSNISTYNTWDHSEISKQLKEMYAQVRNDGFLVVLYSSFLLGKKEHNNEWKDLKVSDWEASLQIANIKESSQLYYINPLVVVLLRKHSVSPTASRISSILASIFTLFHTPGYIVVFCQRNGLI